MTQPERKDRERLSIASDEPKKERPSITGMDVRRSPQKSRKRLMIGGGIAVVVALLASTMLLDPALPAVDESSLLFGTVERGSFVREVRGLGLMVGIELRQKVGSYLKQLMETERVIALPAGSNVLRLLPPLVISEDEIDEAVRAIRNVLAA